MNIELLYRLAWRRARRHPLQYLLFIVGVAIGVAMMVSIDLANGSARRAFALSTDAITGKATHRVVGGPAGLDEDIYRRIRVEAGFAPPRRWSRGTWPCRNWAGSRCGWWASTRLPSRPSATTSPRPAAAA
jgi:hypothetical protein